MDFIERIFHMSPDGGSGLTESLVLLVVALVPLAFAALRASAARVPRVIAWFRQTA